MKRTAALIVVWAWAFGIAVATALFLGII